MTSLLLNLLLAAVALTLYWGGYRLLFCRRHAWREQRSYLLLAALLSAATPLLRLPMVQQTVRLQYTADAFVVPTADAEGMNMVTVIVSILFVTYLLVVLINMVGLIYNQVALWKDIRQLPDCVQGGIHVHRNPHGTLSYSYGKHIVLGTKGLTDKEVEYIVWHEVSHVRHGHTYDLLLMQLMEIVFWFNPVTRLYTRELRKIHDYVADADALRHADRGEYARLLCAQTNARLSEHHPAKVLCNFKSGDFKKRVDNLYHLDNRRRPLTLIVLLPLVALCVVTNSCANPSSPEPDCTPRQDTLQITRITSPETGDSAIAIEAHLSIPSKHITLDGKEMDTADGEVALKGTITPQDSSENLTDEEIESVIRSFQSVLTGLFTEH